MYYKGHPINKLQNVIIVLIFKIYKIQDIRFVGTVILNASCEFHFGDVTNIIQGGPKK